MIKVTLDTMDSITVTPNHFLVEALDGKLLKEKPSREFAVGQKMITSDGVSSKVISCERIKTNEAVFNVIMKGNPITNGIVTSYRVENDFPEYFLSIGMQIYDNFGPYPTSMFCAFANKVRKPDRLFKST